MPCQNLLIYNQNLIGKNLDETKFKISIEAGSTDV